MHGDLGLVANGYAGQKNVSSAQNRESNRKPMRVERLMILDLIDKLLSENGLVIIRNTLISISTLLSIFLVYRDPNSKLKKLPALALILTYAVVVVFDSSMNISDATNDKLENTKNLELLEKIKRTQESVISYQDSVISNVSLINSEVSQIRSSNDILNKELSKLGSGIEILDSISNITLVKQTKLMTELKIKGFVFRMKLDSDNLTVKEYMKRVTEGEGIKSSKNGYYPIRNNSEDYPKFDSVDEMPLYVYFDDDEKQPMRAVGFGIYIDSTSTQPQIEVDASRNYSGDMYDWGIHSETNSNTYLSRFFTFSLDSGGVNITMNELHSRNDLLGAEVIIWIANILHPELIDSIDEFRILTYDNYFINVSVVERYSVGRSSMAKFRGKIDTLDSISKRTKSLHKFYMR